MSLDYEDTFENPFTYLTYMMPIFSEIIAVKHIDETSRENSVNMRLGRQISRITRCFERIIELSKTERKYDVDDIFKTLSKDSFTTELASDMKNLYFQMCCKYIDALVRKYKSNEIGCHIDALFDRIESITLLYKKDFIYNVLEKNTKIDMSKPSKFYIIPLSSNISNQKQQTTTMTYSFYIGNKMKDLTENAVKYNTITTISSLGIPILFTHNQSKVKYYLCIEYVLTYSQPLTSSNFHLIIPFLMFRNTKCIKNTIHQDILNNYYDNLMKKNINVFTQMLVFKIIPLQNYIIQEHLFNSTEYYNLINQMTISYLEQLKKSVLTDEELIELLQEKVEPPKKTNKKIKNKNKKNNSIKSLDIETIEETPLITEEMQETIKPSIIPSIEETEYIEKTEDIDNKLIVFNKYEIELPFKTSFNRYEKFCKYDIDYINYLLKDLYEKNNKFQLFIDENEYNYVKIIKNIHTDLNRKDISLHFNAQFCSVLNRTKTSTFHLYIFEDAIVSITKLENILE